MSIEDFDDFIKNDNDYLNPIETPEYHIGQSNSLPTENDC